MTLRGLVLPVGGIKDKVSFLCFVTGVDFQRDVNDNVTRVVVNV